MRWKVRPSFVGRGGGGVLGLYILGVIGKPFENFI